MTHTVKGLTFVEMMITISIFSIGMAGLSLLFSRSWSQNANIIEIGRASATASRGVDRIVGYIREARQGDDGAYPVISAEENALVFYGDYDRDGVVERLHVYRDNNEVRLGIREPNDTFPITYDTGDGSVEMILSGIANDVADPLFAYYDSEYPEDSVNNPIPMPVTVPDVRLVQVTILVDPEARAGGSVKIQSFAEMRNLNDHDRFGI